MNKELYDIIHGTLMGDACISILQGNISAINMLLRIKDI